jgi:3-isopropylmalate/(R)-2-methylmalate dehydratase small subunit
MEKFTQLTGVAAPILQINVDTDAIIPSREMKRVSKLGLGEGLFAAWRYTVAGGREPNPDFVLNKPAYANTKIILSGSNFGCGSSREHAVWALHEYGIRCIIAPSFGSIFFQNCIRNGILPVVADDDTVKALANDIEKDPANRPLTIDLEAKQIIAPDGQRTDFTIEDTHRDMLLQGLDPIALTLAMESNIRNFESSDKTRRPWIYFD